MIPATQRPDGSWRKARKIRTGFSSSSGGATRYVPPAFRNYGGCSGDKDGDGGRAVCHTSAVRSLGEVDAADGSKRGSSRLLSAALFLLTATPAGSTSTRTEGAGLRKARDIKEEGTSRGGGASRSGSSAGNQTSALRAAARAAEDKIGCNDCVHLFPESHCFNAVVAAAAAAADVAISPEESTQDREHISDKHSTRSTGASSENSRKNTGYDSNRGNREEQDGRSGKSSSSSSSNEWWSRLRQAERGWIASQTGRREGSTTVPAAGEGWARDSWAGLELQLRSSDLRSPDGQTAIVDFLKGSVEGGHLFPREEERRDERGGGGDEGVRSPEEIRPLESTEPTELTAASVIPRSPATAAEGGEEGGEGGYRKDSSIIISSSSPGRIKDADGAVAAATDDTVAAQERGGSGSSHQTKEAEEVTVLLAVLVFGSELSKRDRAELHDQAEKADGVASSSHGVGDGRFLSLTYGLGSRVAAVELELSPEKAEFARHLFRLSQEEYHSRYECLSHGEIREVVALGGPNALDHPDLFKLVEKHQQQQQQHTTTTTTNKATVAQPIDGNSNTTIHDQGSGQ